MATQIILALLTLGAIARVTRFVVDDILFQPVRTAVGQRGSRRLFTWLADLMACSWCTSIWASAAAAVAHWLWHDTAAYLYVVAALTASHVVSLAASWLDSPTPPRHIVLNPLAIDMAVRDQRR
ncbi:DUF1360 domain-containing protein [Streptomyces kasugaensis]|uniref:DUF1360 domain-containing protein n=1 Tax=Streptomyces kasugaensis TaxID=1946 RepID=A0A4Q9HPG7_STRKA|nr:DUF1360 domain-containing protein [Streptomyces kasugaensis]TBO56768.1 DUF1360 domain-containing protein [Streptomyces kasugaensis]